MTSADERARRKRMRDAYKNAERAARTSLMPLDVEQLAHLVDAVHARLLVDGCDHTKRFTEQWAHTNGASWERLAEGLEKFGGYCDCEVVMNCGPDEVFG